jgi:hypothetical protein
MTANISVFDPTAPDPAKGRLTHRALSELKGKVVGFIDNSKPNFNYLIDDVGALLISEYGVKAVVKHRKPMASLSITKDALADMAGKCDLVITGSGD